MHAQHSLEDAAVVVVVFVILVQVLPRVLSVWRSLRQACVEQRQRVLQVVLCLLLNQHGQSNTQMKIDEKSQISFVDQKQIHQKFEV
jgi:uncharacterized protein YeaC (DUF1315 family)